MVGKISLRADFEAGTARSVGQRLTGAPKMRVGVHNYIELYS